MKLILAISVVIVALSVLAEPSSAHAEESTIKEKFDSATGSLKVALNKAHEKMKTAFDTIRTSEPVTKTSNWLSELGKKVKDAFTKK